MSRSVSNVAIPTDNFAQWLDKTNQLLYSLSTEIVTANSSANGAVTTGNAQVVGIFLANTLIASANIRGGNTSVSANLNITSNVIITGATVNTTANLQSNNANTYFDADVFSIVGGNTTHSSNLTISGTFVNSSANLQSNNVNTYFDADVLNLVGGNVVATSNVIVTGANVSITSTNVAITSNLNVTGIVAATGNTSFKSNSSVTVLTLSGNSTTSNAVFAGNDAFFSSNVKPTSNIQLLGNTDARWVLNANTGNFTGIITTSANVIPTTNAINLGTTTGRWVIVANSGSFSANVDVVSVNATTSANVGSNVSLSTSGVVVGNSTINTVANSSSITISNSTFATVVNNSSVTIGGSYNTYAANGDLGTDTSSALLVYSFPKATYSGAKLVGVAKKTNDTHTSEILLTHNGTTSYLTVYGSVVSSANLGSYSTAINNANVEVYFTQANINSSIKLSVNLL
jgi:hypothetical protein